MKISNLMVLGLCLAAFGCDDESDDGTTAKADAAQGRLDTGVTRLDTGVVRLDTGIQPDSSVVQMDSAVTADSTVVVPDMFVFVPPPTVVASCEDVNLSGCFSNFDCQGDFEICLNLGTAELGVPCCFAADVGQKTVGMPCVEALGESECDTSICITEATLGSYCSDHCETVDDCPANMQDCRVLAFSGDDTGWCFPTGE